jgi:hypothetical protein
MTDYTDAAHREATVRLADGSEWCVHFVPAGVDGWNVPVIRAYDYTDDTQYWNTDGTALSADADIVEVVE